MSRARGLLLIEPLSLQQLLGKVDRVPMGASEEVFRPKKGAHVLNDRRVGEG